MQTRGIHRLVYRKSYDQPTEIRQRNGMNTVFLLFKCFIIMDSLVAILQLMLHTGGIYYKKQ